MSELKEAADYIGGTKTVVLGTVTAEGFPALRTLGGFANDGLNVYLSTSKDSGKVEQIQANANATLLFQQEGQELSAFRSVTLTGTIKKVCSKCGEEYNHAVNLLSSRSPRFKAKAENGDLDQTVILKFVPDRLK
ncbi:MAG: pyridoxamine 5'-phosphate oxidase family protein, partial [Gorillibacterium sp.]|nr:pyridoxamine 5'-phosphate oxidase family protein [Gorillibacterium sp.]